MQKVLHLLSLALVVIVGICFVGLQPFPILHDYPEWMYQGWLAHHLLFGDGDNVVNIYSLTDYPVPNSITQFAIAVLNHFSSPIAAGKIWLAVYLVYASILWLVLSRRLFSARACARSGRITSQGGGQDGAIHLLLTMTITFGPGFWNGYANFQFALLFWGTYLLSMRAHRDGVLVHLLLSLLIFFSHASVFIAFVGLVVVRALFGRLNWRYLAVISPSMILFSWYLIATIQFDAIGQLNSLGPPEWLQYKVYTVAKQGYFHNFIVADGSSLLGNIHVAYLAGVALNLGVAMIIVVWLLYQGWYLVKGSGLFSLNWLTASDEENRDRDVTHRETIVALLALMLLFLVAGKDNFGVVNLGERFLIAAVLLALVQLQCPRPIRNVWVCLAAVGAVYTMIAAITVTGYPVQEYAVVRSTTSSTLGGAIDDIYANSRHKLFNHRLYIYADHGIWLEKPSADLLPLKHITSIIVPE